MGLSKEEQRNKIRGTVKHVSMSDVRVKLSPKQLNARKKKSKYKFKTKKQKIQNDKIDVYHEKVNKTKKEYDLTYLHKKPYSEFLKSGYWFRVRKTVILRDNKKCTRCESKKGLQVHHLTYKNHFKEHEHLEDLVTLCRKCHKKEHNIE